MPTVYLQMPYTDRAGTPHPQAVIVIDTALVQYKPPANAAEIGFSIYHDKSAWQGGVHSPVEQRPPTPLTPAEINTYVSVFAAVAYQILKARPEFQSADLKQEP